MENAWYFEVNKWVNISFLYNLSLYLAIFGRKKSDITVGQEGQKHECPAFFWRGGLVATYVKTKIIFMYLIRLLMVLLCLM